VAKENLRQVSQTLLFGKHFGSHHAPWISIQYGSVKFIKRAFSIQGKGIGRKKSCAQSQIPPKWEVQLGEGKPGTKG